MAGAAGQGCCAPPMGLSVLRMPCRRSPTIALPSAAVSPRCRDASSRRVLRVEQEMRARVRVLISTAAPVCSASLDTPRHPAPSLPYPSAPQLTSQPHSLATPSPMPGGGGGKLEIGDLELAPIAPKYGPYLALPAGPEPAVWRLAPKTGRSGPNAGQPRVAYPGGTAAA